MAWGPSRVTLCGPASTGGLAGVLFVVRPHPRVDESRHAVEQRSPRPRRLVWLRGVGQVNDRKLGRAADFIEHIILIVPPGERSRRPLKEGMPSSRFPCEL